MYSSCSKKTEMPSVRLRCQHLMVSFHFHFGVLQLPGDIQFQCYGVNKHSSIHDINTEISDLPYFCKINLLKVVRSRKVLTLPDAGKKIIGSQTKDQDPAMCSSSSFIHVWHYSPCWAVASLKRHLHSSISPVNLLHPHSPGIYNAFF